MLNYITALIIDLDIFAYKPEDALTFLNRKQFPTFPGGCISIQYLMVIIVVWYLQLYSLFTYGNNTNSSNTSLSDVKLVEKVSDLKSYPMY